MTVQRGIRYIYDLCELRRHLDSGNSATREDVHGGLSGLICGNLRYAVHTGCE